jgi:uncharacterized membrane protein
MDNVLFVITLLSALGAGLIGGVFFAFSSFVMKGLSRLPAAQGVAVMQSINVTALTPLFMTALLGTAAACTLLVFFSLLMWPRPGAVYLLLGSLLYLAGPILVTRACNVPRNETLAALVPSSADAATRWEDYVRSWTAWNHVRTAAALGAATSLTIALIRN